MTVRDLKDGFRDFWKQFSAVKSGLVGLGMLAFFVFVAIFGGVLSPYPEAGTKWHDITYWQDNPKAVPPAWTNLFARQKSAETERIDGGEGVARDGDGRFLREYAFEYDYRADLPPQDFIFRTNGTGKAQAVLRVERPDGIEAELYRANLDLGSAETHRVSVRNNCDRTVVELVREMDEYAALQIELAKFNPMSALLAVNEPTMVESPQPLKGTYRLTLALESGDAAFRSDGAALTVAGRVSGVFGTDGSKRDIFTGLLFGTRWAILIGLLTSIITVIVGVFLGVIAAYAGGAVDAALSRLYEYVYMLPVLPFLIVLSAIFKPSIWTLIIIICLLFWTGPFKPVYSMALQIKEETFVEAARALGATHRRIVTRHIVPILLPYSFAVMALSIPGVIVYEASVSLLGLGDSSIITFGQMLNESFHQNAVVSGLWWWVVPPGLLIALMGMSFAFLGTALDKILHPKLKTR